MLETEVVEGVELLFGWKVQVLLSLSQVEAVEMGRLITTAWMLLWQPLELLMEEIITVEVQAEMVVLLASETLEAEEDGYPLEVVLVVRKFIKEPVLVELPQAEKAGSAGVVLVKLTVQGVAVAILVDQEVGMVQEEGDPIILVQTNHPVSVQVMEMVV